MKSKFVSVILRDEDYSLPTEDFIFDKKIFLEALYHILANAIKFSQLHSCVTITIQNTEEHLQVLVQDEGAGMSSEQLGTLFETFNLDNEGRNNQQRGIGIGLSTSKALIELLGGSITIESEGQNKGTIVRIQVPLDQQQQQQHMSLEFKRSKSVMNFARNSLNERARFIQSNEISFNDLEDSCDNYEIASELLCQQKVSLPFSDESKQKIQKCNYQMPNEDRVEISNEVR